ncbi:MAG TPA: APC family permease [Ktedonobacterales bacterium]|nr:APC family permease [Ktedonobacterales bacterium]
MSTRKLADEDSSFSLEADTQEQPESPHLSKTVVSLDREELIDGSRPGNKYVRVYMSPVREFRRLGPGRFEATEQAGLPQSPLRRKLVKTKRFLIGAPISSERAIHERLNKIKGLAVLSSDAISSSAYGTEASLAILLVAGASSLALNLGIALVIITLLAIVGLSYRQTIYAYPNGGGSYIVAKDNLGTSAGLVAAASLLIDYILTVSVSIAAGVDAITSALPALYPYSVAMGLAFTVLITVINLRGVRESGTIFAAPTYLFIFSFSLLIIAGVVHAITNGGLLHAVPPPAIPASETLTPFLLLTAFASGCAGITGVEAISNGVPAFKPPESRNAARTLVWMVTILGIFLAGTTFLSWRFGIAPNPQSNPTVDSQIATLAFPGPFVWMYFIFQFATALILALAANTSFADFPRLSSLLARDGFLPHQFAFRGDRLAFSTGIVVLGVFASVLLVVFKGNTEALINLYAIGVFMSFTLSQSGMVVHWWRLRGQGWRKSLVINLSGAIATAVVVIIVTMTKFERGAWLVVILIPLVFLMFRAVHHHYERARAQVAPLTPVAVDDVRHIMLVPIADLNQPALQSLAYARSITPDVVAVHVATEAEEAVLLQKNWELWVKQLEPTIPQKADAAPADPTRHPHLILIESPYRSLVAPLLAYIDLVRRQHPHHIITVVLPEYIAAHWWEALLHNQTALRLKTALLFRPGIVVTNVPYHLKR